jgi:peptide/nickel transport system substrate-binding protein
MNRFGLSRRASLKLAGTTLGALLIEANLGRLAYAKSADTLVIGMDISDTNSFDPGHQFVYSAPITMRATYETLVTMAPGEYSTLLPLLAESWELADDGAALVFHLRKDVKFSSGNEMTATDVQFTFDRLRNLKDNPAELASNIASVAVVDPHTVKIVMVDKAQPLLTLLVGPSFVISASTVVQEHGGTSAADADKTDTANKWLDHVPPAGPYVLSQWEPNQKIVRVMNEGYR